MLGLVLRRRATVAPTRFHSGGATTGATPAVVDGLTTFGNRGPTDIVFRLGMEYRARAVISDTGEPVWVLEVRRGDETPDTTK